MVGLYCGGNLDNEGAVRPVFEFAQDLGIKYLVAEPALEAYDMLARLCAEYEVKLAVHNHPAPSRYFNPDLREMHRQKWRGDSGIEYEPYRPDNAQRAAECIAFLERVAGQLRH